MRAYGSIVGFSGRSGMLDAAAKIYFHKNPNADQEAEYKRLMTAITRLSARRNEIAHGSVTWENKNEDQDDYRNRKMECFLCPALYNYRKITLNNLPLYKYAAENIKTFRRAFDEINRDLSGFILEFRMTAPPRP